MKRKIIIVADDFGISEAFNYGAIKAYKEGVVSSFNLIVNAPASQHAVDLLKKECPEAELSLHVNYVLGKPISSDKEITSLVDDKGCFYKSRMWINPNEKNTSNLNAVNPSVEDLYKECVAQIDYFEKLVGNRPINFDSHSVVTDNLINAFKMVSKETNIHCPFALGINDSLHEHPLYDNCGLSILKRGCTLDDWLEDSSNLLKSKYDINVLHFHPGYVDKYILDNSSLTYPRCIDLDTLCNPKLKRWLEENNFEILNFKNALEKINRSSYKNQD